MFTKEMQKALEADGEKLRQLTGKDHGPVFMDFYKWESAEHRACDCGSFNVRRCLTAPNGVQTMLYDCEDCGCQWSED